ncbi:MAG: symmetrical bis(5'-nucleosyl)-tetraphosphatase [Gammaproteobacteria bacterium]|nr:symmetrical bis(5'-nucleosyl)-tetraphosphatase [Gammaproteobacteria bacterium]
MATYAVGDLQGCLRELHELLHHINFDSRRDRLWFVGDLVNRGPASLGVLRFVYGLGETAVVVLGNHDLHLLAVAAGVVPAKRKDTLEEILRAPDRGALLEWLRRRPLFKRHRRLGFAMVHAGLPPQWTLSDSARYAKEVEAMLASRRMAALLGSMYGNQPDTWDPGLRGDDRLRFFINCFTRLRYCDDSGRAAWEEKGPPGTQRPPFRPWYAARNRRTRRSRIIFGHWSTVHLGTRQNFASAGVYPLDRGCVWGGELIALRLEDRRLFRVPSRQPKVFED